MKPDPQLWYGKRVLITGHTGFKGTWLSLYLSKLGAKVYGVSLPPEPGSRRKETGRFRSFRNFRFVFGRFWDLKPCILHGRGSKTAPLVIGSGPIHPE